MNNFILEYGPVLYLVQLFFAIIIGLYFWNLLKSQQAKRYITGRDADRENLKLKKLRDIRLTEPLSSLCRPTTFSDLIGQNESIEMLRSALCGPNPQHVLLYGPPGVGKTTAARLVLEEAQGNIHSPFGKDAKFVEVDATISRYDERNIADPLIGSVHDPIYQGAGALGSAGIPQPKPGACTKAHGGILFIDEIGELHPLQLNKLLKVLEERKVMLESAYYSERDENIPLHIHDIFKNGLPADFRLVGATTKMPEEMPPALRSRCLEIFFKPLTKKEIQQIIINAAAKISFTIRDEAVELISRYAQNGRDAVNIVQVALGIAQLEGTNIIDIQLVKKVINNGRFSPRIEIKPQQQPRIGCVYGLAVNGANSGTLIEVEASVIKVGSAMGSFKITGIIEEERLGGKEHSYKRKSLASTAGENVLTVLQSLYGLKTKDYDIHLNFPGGTPVDGPSAGVAMLTAIYSALQGKYVNNLLAMTGEITVYGNVKPVGGILSKIEAAREAGVKRVLIPYENYAELFNSYQDIEICPVREVDEVLKWALIKDFTSCSRMVSRA